MPSDISRKTFLRATGVALTAAIAGCNSSTDSTESNTDTRTTTENSSQSVQQGDNTPMFGNFYVGNPETDSSAVIDGRAEVVYSQPTTATEKSPVVMVPGLGLSPYIYRTTPDGRRGWMEYFVEAGHPVYVFNPPRNVDSGGLDTAALQNSDSVSLSRWSLERAWPTWGFGPEAGNPYEDVRYPVGSVDQLVASFPAYVSTGGSGGGRQGGGQRGGGSGDRNSTPADSTETTAGTQTGSTPGGGGGSRFASPRETAALETLLNRVGPAVLLVHSAGGGSGFAVAQTVPDLVERIVAVEPVGAPTDPQTVADMGGDAAFMGVYGDYVAERGQTSRKAATQTTADLAGDTNSASTLLSLPDEGISGNTHLMMQDDNNGEIADRIITWIGD
ncbi:High potential iron-sulfur protein, Hipip family (plasmid) [Haloferax volcanii]|nr:High potential iron-sulfur protein, Hipip family [Haloferax lucentense]